jgi:hypothetical protein
MTNIMRGDGIFQFQRAASDYQVGERNADPFGGLLATNAGDDLRRGAGNRMNRNMLFQLVQKAAASLRLRLVARVINAMAKLGHREGADDDRYIACGLLDVSGSLLVWSVSRARP